MRRFTKQDSQVDDGRGDYTSLKSQLHHDGFTDEQVKMKNIHIQEVFTWDYSFP